MAPLGPVVDFGGQHFGEVAPVGEPVTGGGVGQGGGLGADGGQAQGGGRRDDGGFGGGFGELGHRGSPVSSWS